MTPSSGGNVLDHKCWHRASIKYAMQNVALVMKIDAVIAAL
jgi:hypothetical protein